ncbi:CHAT domain-containing protein [Actinosynnema sp. CA-248983]
MLAVFSLPHRTTALGQHRERHRLTRLVRGMAEAGRAVDLAVVQYGVTRERLAAIAGAGGWDVVHLSGHGGAGLFALENPDGTRDVVDSATLAHLLRPTRRRLKLVVVSACESAATTTARTAHLLDLEVDQPPAERAPVTGVAPALAQGLGCSVVAMRYPVDDAFATAFAEDFYRRLFAGGAVDAAVRGATAEAAALVPGVPLSVVAPALFSAGHSPGLAAPVGVVRQARPDRMAHFPPEPERFVGRAELMARAAAVLAPGSGRAAVLLRGMAGAGKTSCAVELAYRHQHRFDAVVFWRARPDLVDFALRLEAQLGVAVVDKLSADWLTDLLDRRRVLLVLDNLETVLDADGPDDRWPAVWRALSAHRGDSRVIFTSRVALPGADVEELSVSALSRDEALLLTRELPNLGRMLHPEAVRATGAVAADRYLVRRVLAVVQGHPKLLELADAAAADRRVLVTRLNQAEAHAAERGTALSGFFEDGGGRTEAQFVDTLAHWTLSTLAALPEPARLLARLLASTEDGDRGGLVVQRTWEALWHRLDRPGPAPEPPLDALHRTALARVEDGTVDLHPGVAEAIRHDTDPDTRKTFDVVLALWWDFVFRQGAGQEGAEHSGSVLRAALSSTPYLVRLGEYPLAAQMLLHAVIRDAAPGTVHTALAALRRMARLTDHPDVHEVLAQVLRHVDPAEAEALLRHQLATAGDDHGRAARAAAGLFNLLRDRGKLSEALAVAEQAEEHSRKAGHGPWSRLLGRAARLQALGLMGRHADVLAETDVLRAEMARLPDRPGVDEVVEPWAVREMVLDGGCESALALREWETALALNEEAVASKRRRGASSREYARTRFKAFGPLVELDRIDEADHLLRACQRTFEEHGDLSMLVPVFGARALVEYVRGRLDAGLGLQRTALRLGYAGGDVDNTATAHTNLATFLARTGGDLAERRAHRLASALLGFLMGKGHDVGGVLALLAEEYRVGDEPATYADLVRLVERTPGVRFAELVGRFGDGAQALAALLELAERLRRR